MHFVQSNSVFPVKLVRGLHLVDGTSESPQRQWEMSRRTLMSLQHCEIALCTSNQLEVSPDSPALDPVLSRIPHQTRQVLTSLRQLQRFPENTFPNLEKHQVHHSNSRKAPCTPYRLEMRADSQDSTEEVCQLSISTSRGGFHQE